VDPAVAGAGLVDVLDARLGRSFVAFDLARLFLDDHSLARAALLDDHALARAALLDDDPLARVPLLDDHPLARAVVLDDATLKDQREETDTNETGPRRVTGEHDRLLRKTAALARRHGPSYGVLPGRAHGIFSETGEPCTSSSPEVV
jgi:hypothetical protein